MAVACSKFNEKGLVSVSFDYSTVRLTHKKLRLSLECYATYQNEYVHRTRIILKNKYWTPFVSESKLKIRNGLDIHPESL